MISQKKRPIHIHSRAGSRSTTTLQRDSVMSSFTNQTLFKSLAAISVPRDMRTT